MTTLLLDCLIDALKDGALSIPVLYIAYLLMELLESSKRLNENILRAYSRKAGPAIGGLLGAIPQCGISGAAATLFSTGTITVGTMLAVFFATSDEMLPVLLSALAGGEIAVGRILGILGAKVALGIALGYAADMIFRALSRGEKSIHSLCERDNCECGEEGSVWLSALRHTVKIALMLIAVNFALNLILTLVGAEKLSALVFARPVVGELLLALLGLIPNCSVSVVITEAYLSNLIGLGGLFAGLLSNAGIGLVVLFRTNRDLKENLLIVGVLFALSAVTGAAIGLIMG